MDRLLIITDVTDTVNIHWIWDINHSHTVMNGQENIQQYNLQGEIIKSIKIKSGNRWSGIIVIKTRYRERWPRCTWFLRYYAEWSWETNNSYTLLWLLDFDCTNHLGYQISQHSWRRSFYFLNFSLNDTWPFSIFDNFIYELWYSGHRQGLLISLSWSRVRGYHKFYKFYCKKLLAINIYNNNKCNQYPLWTINL